MDKDKMSDPKHDDQGSSPIAVWDAEIISNDEQAPKTSPETVDNVGDLPPRPSRATRQMARRNKISSRGGIVAQLPNWDRPRVVYFESKLEQRVLFLLLARADVVDLWEQPPLIHFRDEDGQVRHHFFDFLVSLKSDRRVAIAVKPATLVERYDFTSKLRCIRQAVGEDFADDVVLITDKNFTKEESLNAERYHDFARSKVESLSRQLEVVIASASFPTTINALAAKLDAPGLGFRAAVIAIHEGRLRADRTKVFDLDTVVYAGEIQ